jgi:DNA-binding LacI/PurR family transcriptional regulator
MVKDIEKAARKHNYTIFVINTVDDNELEERAIYTAIGKNVDGIIICPAQHSSDNIRFIQNFTAIFAFNDVFAWEAVYMLRKIGYRVPEDYSVIGFDNIQSRNLFPFPLSSISNSKSKMSRRALDILLHTCKRK